MSIIGTVLASIGGLTVIIGIACGIVHLHELFERVEQLECHDEVRRGDILYIKSQLIRIEMREETGYDEQ